MMKAFESFSSTVQPLVRRQLRLVAVYRSVRASALIWLSATFVSVAALVVISIIQLSAMIVADRFRLHPLLMIVAIDLITIGTLSAGLISLKRRVGRRGGRYYRAQRSNSATRRSRWSAMPIERLDACQNGIQRRVIMIIIRPPRSTPGRGRTKR